MTAQDIYITELIKRNNTHESIVNQISKYYELSITEASQLSSVQAMGLPFKKEKQNPSEYIMTSVILFRNYR